MGRLGSASALPEGGFRNNSCSRTPTTGRSRPQIRLTPNEEAAKRGQPAVMPSGTLPAVTSTAPPPAPPSRSHSPAPWPHGQGRPAAATAAAGFGVAAAALTILVGLGSLLISDSPLAVWVAVAAVLTGAALIIGAWRLLTRRGSTLMVTGAVGAIVILSVGAMLDAELRSDGLGGVLIWLVLAGSPAISAAVLSASPRVRGWLSRTH